MDLKFTFKILILAIIGFLVISSIGEFITLVFFDIFGLDKESMWSWLILGIVGLIILISLLLIFRIELHDVIGISETVDTALTGQTEQIIGKTIMHIQN